VIFQYRNVRIAADFLSQNVLNGKSRCIGNVNDATGTVPAFSRQVIACIVLGKGNALFDEPFNGTSAIFDNETRGLFIVEPSAGDQGVLNMRFN